MFTNPFDDDLYSKLNTLQSAADQYYKLSEVVDAADLYNRALELAESLNYSQRIIYLRRWCGACNYEGGRLKKALAILAPIMASPTDNGSLEDIYVAMIKYVEIAQEIPVRLSAINRGYNNISNLLHDTGNTDWQHMYYRKFSELLKKQGLFDQALGMAQESWYKFKANSTEPSFLAEEYLYNLVDLCIRIGDISQSKYFIEIWRNENSSVPSYKEMTLLIRESELLRKENLPYDSVELARKAVGLARQANHYWRIGCATKAFIRSMLMAKNFSEASHEFLRFSYFRHSESQHEQYDFHILRGDLYYSYLRFLGDLPMIDQEYEVLNQYYSHIYKPDQEWTIKLEQRKLAEKYKNLSLNAYLVAQKIGKNVDALLESDYRTSLTTYRIQELMLCQII